MANDIQQHNHIDDDHLLNHSKTLSSNKETIILNLYRNYSESSRLANWSVGRRHSYYCLGRLYENLGNWSLAIENLLKSWNLSSHNDTISSTVVMSLANCYSELNQENEALK